MSWIGKIIGGLIGLWLLRNPLGVLLGVLIGHQFDRSGAASGADSALVRERFFPALFRVMGHVAKADGRVSEQEIAAARAMMAALRLTPEQTQQAIGFFTEGKQPQFDLDAAIASVRPALRGHPELAQFFIEVQLQVALAGNGLGAAERPRLARVAALLGISATDFSRLETIMRWRADMSGAHTGGYSGSRPEQNAGQALARAYTLLELTPPVTDEQVVKAYRRQMSKHHPDKLQAQGLPESMLERAKERTQQIQAAYERIRTARGMR
jgi:DnaJ like chaperone protein